MKKTRLYKSIVDHLRQNPTGSYEGVQESIAWLDVVGLYATFKDTTQSLGSLSEGWLTLPRFIEWVDIVQPYQLENLYNSHQLIELFTEIEYDN